MSSDIRRVHHRSSRPEYDYDYDYKSKSHKSSNVSSRVVKKEPPPPPVYATSRRIKLTVTASNDRRSSISPSPQRSKSKRSKTRSRSRGRKPEVKQESKSSKKTESKKSPIRDSQKSKSKETEVKKSKSKKKSRSRSRSITRTRSRSRSNSMTRYYNYPPHYYYDYYPPHPGSRSRSKSRSRSISRSKSRSPEPYRSKPAPYPVSYYPPGPLQPRFRPPYPGMRYPPPQQGMPPYYQPHPQHMQRFPKFRPRFMPPGEDGEFYSNRFPNPNFKYVKKEPEQEPIEVLEEPKSPSATDPELTEAVGDITTAIANASAEGKEYVLTEEQKNILQKHQQVIQDYQQKKQKYLQLLKLRSQSQLNQEQMSALLSNKKFPNYRLLGRNIFEPNAKQKFFQKRIKTNTYYSRFIKQHPTTNLPLVFQKSVGLNDDKQNDEDVEMKVKKKKKSKKKKKVSDTSSSSDSSDGEKKSKKIDDVLEDGQIQTNIGDSSSSSSSSSSSDSSSGSDESSSSSSSSDESDKRSKRKKKNKFNNDARNGHTDSDSSMLDLKENLKPIGSYIKDRERMLNEMFRCIKGSKLRAMLPDILKTRQLREVKERCLEALECMSKKRIRCLLNDQPMLSSSGTEESSEDESNSSDNSDSDRSLNHSKSKLKKKVPESKFRPIGSDSFKQIEEPHDESNEDSQTSLPSKDEKPQASKSTTGIAAAGFKNFIKKSISIKIKTNDQMGGGGQSPSETTTLQSTTTQLTDLQKQKMAISNKLAKKIKIDTNNISMASSIVHEEPKAVQPSQPKTSSDLTNLSRHQHVMPTVIPIQPGMSGGPGLLPTPNVPPNMRPGFISVPPPGNFSYPPPRVPPVVPGVPVVTRPPIGIYPQVVPPPNLSGPPPGYALLNQPPPNAYPNMPPPVNQQIQFQPQGQSLLGPVPTHLPPQFHYNQRYQDDYSSYIDEDEEMGNEDSAYDLDDNVYNYDLDEDLDSIMNESKSRKRDRDSKKRSKKKDKKHKRKKYDTESEQEESEENLDDIKNMLKNVLEINIANLDESDEDLRLTLNGLLDQVVNDDGSLTYEDCVNIHETVKSLFGEREEGEESYDEESKRKKKKKSSTKRKNKSSEDLKPSKKKRKENGKRDDDDGEEGEIDDVYDDDQQFIVEKEYQDLLKY